MHQKVREKSRRCGVSLALEVFFHFLHLTQTLFACPLCFRPRHTAVGGHPLSYRTRTYGTACTCTLLPSVAFCCAPTPRTTTARRTTMETAKHGAMQRKTVLGGDHFRAMAVSFGRQGDASLPFWCSSFPFRSFHHSSFVAPFSSQPLLAILWRCPTTAFRF